MDTQERWKKKVRRTARMARIIERIERLDDPSLEELDRLIREAMTASRRRRPGGTTRREFITTIAASGALVATTSGLAAWQLGSGKLDAVQEEVRALRELAELYEEMDAVGLDAQLAAQSVSLSELVADTRTAAESLEPGLASGRAALQDFQSRFPPLQSAFQWLQRTASTLSQRLLALENSVNALLGIAGPLRETTGGFMSWLLDQLPASAPEAGREALERTGEIISTLTDLQEGLYTHILEPTADWFSPRPDAGLNGQVVSPVVDGVLDPGERLLGEVIELAEAWESQLHGPAEQSLQRRAEIRARIRQHRETHDL
jgi:hypothetical protein